MTTTITKYVVLKEDEGLRLQSGPGRDLVFKVTGQDTNGAFDYFTVDVAPHGGPPLHVHHVQEETVHVLKGRFKIRIGDSIHYLNEGGFAYLPSKVPHAFLNLTDDAAKIIVVYAPGGGHTFYEELGPISRAAGANREQIAAVFEKHGMTLLGGPLTAD
jgi:quercetin dioxygenase-like cupin family protein